MKNERGEGRIGLIFALAVLVVAIYVGVKVIPLKVALFAFSDEVEQRLQRASWRVYETGKAETIKYVVERAEATGYPTEKLKVTVPPPRGGDMIVVVDWQIPLDFAVYQYTWNYHLEKHAPMLGRGGPSF
jgi:hypothetical protein